MAHENLPEKFQAGRVILSQEHPYLSSAIYRMIPVAKPGLGTMAVDAWWRLYFDPTCDWDPRTVATVLYHETGHLLREHSARSDAMRIEPDNFMAWNMAADCEINDDVIEELGARAKWPFDPCTPANTFQKPNGLTAEEYYGSLPVQKRAQGGDASKPKAGAGNCGGSAGAPGRWEDGPPAGEVDKRTGEKGKEGNAPGITDVEADMIRHKVAADIREASKSRGTVPEWMKRWADTLLEPVMPWQKILAGMVRHALADVAGQVNFTYQRPSRRQTISRDVVFPALRKPVPNIAVVVDTSGSMGGDALAEVLGEVAGILKAAGATGVDAIVADADVKSARRVFKTGQIELAGGGGTDMRVGIDKALDRPVKPHIVIVLTDGYTPWPNAPTKAKIVAAIVGGGQVEVPAWIRRVDVKK